MQATHFRRSVLFAAIGSALLAASGTAGASAFALVESGAAGLGNAYAGAAAVAEDASTIGGILPA
jgi:long-chain fatty acid transport protein